MTPEGLAREMQTHQGAHQWVHGPDPCPFAQGRQVTARPARGHVHRVRSVLEASSWDTASRACHVPSTTSLWNSLENVLPCVPVLQTFPNLRPSGVFSSVSWLDQLGGSHLGSLCDCRQMGRWGWSLLKAPRGWVSRMVCSHANVDCLGARGAVGGSSYLQ